MKKVILAFFFVLLASVPARGADYGVKSIQVMAGYVLSPVFRTGERPDLNYVTGTARFEWARFGKHLQFLSDITYSETTTGSEGYMAGGTLILRYDFKQIENITPYAQIGAGVLYTNIYKDYSQSLIGNNIEFSPQGSLGFRYSLNQKCSVDAEGMFHHVSNAGFGDRNTGVNGIGGFVGLTYYWNR